MTSPSRPPRTDALIVFALCVLAYGLLQQGTFYGPDGWGDLRRVAGGDPRSEMHLLYKPSLVALAALGDRLGLTLYSTAVWFSALGTAIGVAWVHLAGARLGLSRGAVWLCTGMVALAPAIVFYATIVERHGPFFAYAGFCTWVAAVFATRPGGWTAIAFAGSLVLSYAAHSTGVLMGGVLMPIAMAEAARRNPELRWSRLWLLAIVAGVATVLGLALIRTVWAGQSQNNFEFFAELTSRNLSNPALAFESTWTEWVVPFAPMSVLWLAAFLRPPLRMTAIAMACGTAVYLFVAFGILAGRFDERGAYLLPLAFPAALLVVLVVPRWGAALAVAAAAVLAVVQVVDNDTRPHAAEASSLRRVCGEGRPYLVLGDPIDFEILFRHFPELRPHQDYWDVIDAGGFEVAEARAAMPILEGILAAHIRAGRPVLISDRSLQYLEQPLFTERKEAGPLLLAFLRDRFRFERVEVGAYSGSRLRLRP